MLEKANDGRSATDYLVAHRAMCRGYSAHVQPLGTVSSEGGDRARATIRCSGPASSSAEADTGEEEPEGVGCAICLDAKASWIFEACGHKCICKACARKQKEKMLGCVAKKKGRKKGAPVVTCPLCRAETRVVPGARYDGDVFD